MCFILYKKIVFVPAFFLLLLLRTFEVPGPPPPPAVQGDDRDLGPPPWTCGAHRSTGERAAQVALGESPATGFLKPSATGGGGIANPSVGGGSREFGNTEILFVCFPLRHGALCIIKNTKLDRAALSWILRVVVCAAPDDFSLSPVYLYILGILYLRWVPTFGEVLYLGVLPG